MSDSLRDDLATALVAADLTIDQDDEGLPPAVVAAGIYVIVDALLPRIAQAIADALEQAARDIEALPASREPDRSFTVSIRDSAYERAARTVRSVKVAP